MVEAHAVDLYVFAIEEKSLIRIEKGLSDPDGRFVFIHHLRPHAN